MTLLIFPLILLWPVPNAAVVMAVGLGEGGDERCFNLFLGCRENERKEVIQKERITNWTFFLSCVVPFCFMSYPPVS